MKFEPVSLRAQPYITANATPAISFLCHGVLPARSTSSHAIATVVVVPVDVRSLQSGYGGWFLCCGRSPSATGFLLAQRNLGLRPEHRERAGIEGKGGHLGSFQMSSCPDLTCLAEAKR